MAQKDDCILWIQYMTWHCIAFFFIAYAVYVNKNNLTTGIHIIYIYIIYKERIRNPIFDTCVCVIMCIYCHTIYKHIPKHLNSSHCTHTHTQTHGTHLARATVATPVKTVDHVQLGVRMWAQQAPTRFPSIKK